MEVVANVSLTSELSKHIVRPGIADYHPTVWGDYFITNHLPSPAPDTEWIKQRATELKDQVRTMLVGNARDVVQEMNLIDMLQRYGVSYHFEKEIGEALKHIDEQLCVPDDDLHAVALRFRLLRQQGYKAPSDVFNKFKGTDGSFKSELNDDIDGLMSLYEAAYLGVPGEKILDDAIDFTKAQLSSKLDSLDAHLREQVSYALQTPLRKRLGRLVAKHYISTSKKEEDMGTQDRLVLEFAKLDFHLVQQLHREEIRRISAWWKSLGLASKLSFARDRVVECYFWFLGVYYEPQYSRARVMTSRLLSLLSLMDDIYDVHGTVDELTRYTDVVQRWDLEAAYQLEEYLKLHFCALYDLLKEFEDELTSDEKYRMHYLKEAIKESSRAWFQEAKWRDEGYVPTLKEYLDVSFISTCYPLLSCASYVGMGEEATKEAFEWVIGHPKIVLASTTVCRLMDDVVSQELEQKRAHVASAIQCYVKEYGTSIEEACEKLLQMVEDAWKELNEEWLSLPVGLPLLTRILNLTRVMETLYKDFDGYTHSTTLLKGHLTSLLVEPVDF